MIGNSDYPKDQNKRGFHSIWLTKRTKTNIEEEAGKVILDLLLVIYVFEKKKGSIFKVLFHAMVIFVHQLKEAVDK